MHFFKNSDIDKGLEGTGRVYLCGDLKKKTSPEPFPTDGYEIGISYYPEYTFEKAHIHSFNIEYNYVIEGAIKVFMLEEKKEYLFEKGDLFIIGVDEPYVGKELAGTRTIFSKTPGGNDKVLVEMDEALLKWGESRDSVYGEIWMRWRE